MWRGVANPGFEAERHLDEAIRSVRSQTHPDWELLVVDDASGDRTPDIARAHGSEDARIRVLRNASNLGAARSRNAGLAAARGRYVAFLDSGDVWLPNKLEVQLDFMKRTSVAFSYSRYRRISEDGETVGAEIPVPVSLSYSQLLRNTAIATSTVVLDRERLGEVRMAEGFGHEDFATWLSILRAGVIAYAVDDDLVRYRVTAGGLSRNRLRSASRVWRIYRERGGLGSLRAAWCFGGYAFRAWRKHATLSHR